MVGSTCKNKCPLGRYGENCTEICECMNGGECGRVKGRCKCLPGYTGEKCEQGWSLALHVKLPLCHHLFVNIIIILLGPL